MNDIIKSQCESYNKSSNKCDYNSDIKTYKNGEEIFILDFLNIFYKDKWKDVRNDKQYQRMDIDFIIGDISYEIKTNYNMLDNVFYIEEYRDFDNKIFGWFYYSKTNYFVLIDKESRMMVIIPNDKILHYWYEINKNNYKLNINKPTYSFNKKLWQSAFRCIPILDLPMEIFGYINKKQIKLIDGKWEFVTQSLNIMKNI